MNGMTQWAREMVRGVGTVITGMGITLRHMTQAPVTMHYPDEKWMMPEAFRGLIKCDDGACIVCDLCVKACPVDCISIEWKREPGKTGKTATLFTVDYQRCMYCGLCAEPCPTDAIFHSHEYENCSYTRTPQVIDWCKPEFRVKNPNAKPMKAEKPAPRPPAPAKPAAGATAAAVATAPAVASPAGGPVAESGIQGVPASTGEAGTVSKVWIIPGCIVCDLCEDTVSEVFHVTETTSVVQLDHQDKWGEWSDKIIEAAVGCPVNVIHYELVPK